MSRSGYSDELDPLELGQWRGQVASATRGKRGQRLIRDLIAALDAMPVKELVKDELITDTGEVCALGAVARLRQCEDKAREVDPDCPSEVADLFDIAKPLAQEIVFVNDECDEVYAETPAQRWSRVRKWAEDQLVKGKP